MDSWDEIRDILKQVGLSQVEIQKSQAEIQKSQAKTDRQLAENAKQIAKLEISQAKTDRQLAENAKQIAKLEISQAKTDRQLAENAKQIAKLEISQAKTDRQLAKTDRQLKSIGQRLGSIGINTGDFTEELFFRSFQNYPVLGDIRYDVVRRKVEDDKEKTEYDILLHNGYASAIIEVKYKAHHEDIERIIKNKVRAFRNSYPQYAKHKLFLGLATTITYQDLIETAKEQGIYLLTQQGSHVEVVNSTVKSF